MKHEPPEAIRPAPGTAEAASALAERIDQTWQGWLARYTFGITPAGLAETWIAWLLHLGLCPGRIAELAAFPWLHAAAPLPAHGHARDSRFRSALWQDWPFRGYVDAFRSAEAFWDRATLAVPGVTPAHERVINFVAHQWLNALSPSNFFLTNPDIQAAARESCGKSLVTGALLAFEDWQRQVSGRLPPGLDDYAPGKAVAVTLGKVVLRNDLIELIQYSPQTASVSREPILILPAWIMKYYILDLSPHNSLVRWLVAQGHTVFIVSWKNPTSADRDKGMDDYLRDGGLAALDAVTSIFPGSKVHLCGYCLGGTLAMILAAWLAQQKDDRLQTLSLFAAQGDFTEAGEITVFVTDSEVAYLKNMMRAQGYLDTRQMAGAFQMLRSADSIWSHLVRDYWQGEKPVMFDLLAWNADATRMPYRMHSEYLEDLFLDNAFADGHYSAMGRPVAAENITAPVFAVGTESDHVAPWTSVYKVHLMVSGDVTFILTNGGHNAGIVSEPDHPARYFHMGNRPRGAAYLSPEEWRQTTVRQPGSWWTAWETWLKAHGDSEDIPAPTAAGNTAYPALDDAPGLYVRQH